MSEPSDQQDLNLDKTWLSSFLLVLGILAVLVAVFAFFSGGFMSTISTLASAAVFFALSRALDYLHEIVIRLRRTEGKSDDPRLSAQDDSKA